MSTQDPNRVMSRADAGAMIFSGVLGAAFAVWTVVQAALRIVHVLGNSDVRVFAEFAGTIAEAPIGPDGAPVAVELDTAYLTAPELPIASVGALVLEQMVVVAAVLTVITCLLLVMWSVVRGRVFRRRNTVLVFTAAIVGVVGMALAPFFANMGANGAFAWISDRTFDNVILAVDPVQLFGAALIGSLATTVFSVGDRLQRDTAGLV